MAIPIYTIFSVVNSLPFLMCILISKNILYCKEIYYNKSRGAIYYALCKLCYLRIWKIYYKHGE